MDVIHRVRQGECIDSIALHYGFFPDTIWNHPDNRELKDLRRDQNILQPGDEVNIPDLEPRSEQGAAEQRHRFRRKGVPSKLRLVFYRPVTEEDTDDESAAGDSGADDPSVYEEPEQQATTPAMERIADTPYTIDIDGKLTQSESDGDGLVEISIPPNARAATITFDLGTNDDGTRNQLSFPLDLGEMDPIETVAGVRKRLYNMGYLCPATGDEFDAVLRAAITQFQQENDLDASGELDQQTKDKLVEMYGA